MSRKASSKILPLSESQNWPGTRQEEGKHVLVRGTKKGHNTVRERDCKLLRLGPLGHKTEEGGGGGARLGLLGAGERLEVLRWDGENSNLKPCSRFHGSRNFIQTLT